MKLTAAREKFARAIVFDEVSQSEAYRRAYPRSKKWKPTTVHEESSKLAAVHKVATRINELREEKQAKYEAEARKQGIDPASVLREQALSAFFDPASLFDADGRLLPLHLMPEHARRAVKKFKVRGVKTDDDTVQGVVTEVELNDKLAALAKIGEHLGMYRQIHEHHWIQELAKMTDEELAREEELAQSELQRALREREAIGDRLNG